MCCTEAHGKELGSPCASLWHTAKINGIELQPTAVNVGARGARFAVCRGCGTRRTVVRRVVRRVPVQEHTANFIFAVCFWFVVSLFYTHDKLAIRRVPDK